MRTNIAKSARGYLAEFHCHTVRSFDALTSQEELLKACVAKGLGLLTVTEHDRMPDLDARRFEEAGIHVIAGCEFTCERGSHIIGLFIQRGLDKRRPARDIFDHIVGQGGVVLIPHPFKPNSGFCALYPEHEGFMDKVCLMEAYNGGVDQHDLAAIRSLCARFRIKAVAASDAHEASQVGYYATAYPELPEGDLRTALVETQGKLLVDRNHAGRPRSLSRIQRKRVYQEIVVRVPYVLKRIIKLCVYRWRNRGYVPTAARYEELPWG